ncbi:MAG TPA: protein translocase subunit SecD [Acidobacteriota bacterium]|nr:protein translocase subunit SecD [Acidobacteriota bacterium]
MKNLRNRILLIIAVIGLSIYLFYPLEDSLKLGLDLKGGIHMVVEVMVDDALQEEVRQVADQLETSLRDQNVIFEDVAFQEETLDIVISGVEAGQGNLVENEMDLYSPSFSYATRSSGGLRTYTLTPQGAYKNFTRRQAVNQARTVINRRIDTYGVAEPTVTVYGSGDVKRQIIIELPGVDDEQRVKDLITGTGKLELRLVHPDHPERFASRRQAMAAFNDLLPSDYEILPLREAAADGSRLFMVVRKSSVITGSHLKNARTTQHSLTGEPEVQFSMNAEGVALFSRATKEHVGEKLAIVLDDKVYSDPSIREQINTESALITGSYTQEEASDLAVTLKSGALPASIEILETRTIGPSLGRDSIERGIQASILGLVLVVLIMLVVYRLSGINAVLCLVINFMILLGVLAYFKATLTLPGIAGMILTIGMAVDANILIFERIKEELRLNKTVRAAVDAGFGRVFWTIIDTNLTSLVAALFLFQFGTGPVRGFAVTLAVGLLANIFTAVFVSRTFFSILLRGQEQKALSI